MERTKWTDDMLDQRFASMDEKFDLVFSELRLLREEMHAGFAALRAEMAQLRSEMIGFHRQVLYVVLTLWVGLIALFAAQF
jgi:hypothetical protein